MHGYKNYNEGMPQTPIILPRYNFRGNFGYKLNVNREILL